MHFLTLFFFRVVLSLLLLLAAVSLVLFAGKEYLHSQPLIAGEFVSNYVPGTLVTDVFDLSVRGGGPSLHLSADYFPENPGALQPRAAVSANFEIQFAFWESVRSGQIVVRRFDIDELAFPVEDSSLFLQEKIFFFLEFIKGSDPTSDSLLQALRESKDIGVKLGLSHIVIPWEHLQGSKTLSIADARSFLTARTTLDLGIDIKFRENIGEIVVIAAFLANSFDQEKFRLYLKPQELDLAQLAETLGLVFIPPQGRYSGELWMDIQDGSLIGADGTLGVALCCLDNEYDNLSVSTAFNYTHSSAGDTFALPEVILTLEQAEMATGSLLLEQAFSDGKGVTSLAANLDQFSMDLLPILSGRFPLLQGGFGLTMRAADLSNGKLELIFQHGEEWTISNILQQQNLPLAKQPVLVRSALVSANSEALSFEIDPGWTTTVGDDRNGEGSSDSVTFRSQKTTVSAQLMDSPVSLFSVFFPQMWAVKLEADDVVVMYDKYPEWPIESSRVVVQLHPPSLTASANTVYMGEIPIKDVLLAVDNMERPYITASGRTAAPAEHYWKLALTLPLLRQYLAGAAVSVLGHADIEWTIRKSIFDQVQRTPEEADFMKMLVSLDNVGMRADGRAAVRNLTGKVAVESNFQETLFDLSNVSLDIDQKFSLRDAEGKLVFDGKNLTNKSPLSAKINDQKTLLSLTEIAGGTVRVHAQSKIDLAQVLPDGLQYFVGRLASGAAWFDIKLHGLMPSFQHDFRLKTVEIDSDMQGLNIHIPAPFYKPAPSKKTFRLRIDDRQGDISMRMFCQNVADAQLRFQEHPFQLLGGKIILDTNTAHPDPVPPGLLQQRGLEVAGNLMPIDIDGWRRFLFASPPWDIPEDLAWVQESTTRTAFKFNLSSNSMAIQGEKISAWNLSLAQEGKGVYSLALASSPVAGKILMRPISSSETEKGHHIHARFKHLDMDRIVKWTNRILFSHSSSNTTVSISPSHFPILDIEAKEFVYLAMKAQRAKLATVTTRNGLTFANVELHEISDPSRNERLAKFIDASGHWIGGDKPRFQVSFKVDARGKNYDLGKMLTLLDLYQGVDHATGYFEGNLVWPQQPYDIQLKDTTGRMHFDVSGGTVEFGERSMTNLLGLLDVATWSKLLTLDFSQLFSPSVPFSQMRGTVKFADQKMHIEDFSMKSELLDISASGYSDLALEEYNQIIDIFPKPASNFAKAAEVAVFSLATAGDLLAGMMDGGDASKSPSIFKQAMKPIHKLREGIGKVFGKVDELLQEAVFVRYRLTGSWQNPKASIVTPKQQ